MDKTEVALFGIGGFEFFLILLFAFLIFGPDKLPEIAKVVGKVIKKFQSTQTSVSDVIKQEVFDPSADEPFKDPMAALAKVSAAAEDALKPEKAKAAAQNLTAKVSGTAATAATASAAGAASGGESFTARKARYEAEREARRKAEAQAMQAARVEKAVGEAGSARTAAAGDEATVVSQENEQAVQGGGE